MLCETSLYPNDSFQWLRRFCRCWSIFFHYRMNVAYSKIHDREAFSKLYRVEMTGRKMHKIPGGTKAS
jgi:hypothetical protein